MEKRRPRVPIGLPIAGIILLVLGIVLRPVFQGMPEEVLISNTIYNGIPFIMIFIAIIIFFITVIWLVTSVLNNNIPPNIYKPVEMVIIGGIVLGVLGMFQPWWFAAYRIGFHLLLVSTLSFILWSHVIPKAAQRQE